MRCKNCGRLINDNSIFCAYCKELQNNKIDIMKSFNKVSKSITEYSKITYANFFIDEVNIDTIDKLKEVLEMKNGYFRGQNDADWDLNASIYRKNDFCDVNPLKTYKGLLNYYKSNVKEFDDKVRIGNLKYYELLSLMQHYGFHSPLIDFTKDPKVALYFALDNKTIEHDISIYYVEIFDKSILIKSKIKANNLIKNYRVKIISEKEYDDMGYINDDNIVPEGYIIDITNNSRMRIQKGVFLYLNNFILIKDLFNSVGAKKSCKYSIKELNKKISIKKFVINKEVINDNQKYIKNILEPYKGIKDVKAFFTEKK